MLDQQLIAPILSDHLLLTVLSLAAVTFGGILAAIFWPNRGAVAAILEVCRTASMAHHEAERQEVVALLTRAGSVPSPVYFLSSTDSLDIVHTVSVIPMNTVKSRCVVDSRADTSQPCPFNSVRLLNCRKLIS